MNLCLKVDWCSYEAAKYAVMHWHYSKRMPNSKLNKIGAWEDDIFVGSVIFGRGATFALVRQYGLTMTEGCELVRVALREHDAPVTQIIKRSIVLLRKRNPGLRLIVSFADPSQGHIGKIYQAGNWLFSGMSERGDMYLFKGQKRHGRGLRKVLEGKGLRGANVFEKAKQVDAFVKRLPDCAKYRYLYPLDRAMRRQIAPLAQPYPKRAGG